MACQCVVVPMEANLAAGNLLAREVCRHDDERTLVQAAKYGHGFAFDVLCERLSPKILRSLYRITKNREDAEDALQDSFLRAFVHLSEFDGRSAFSTWLTRIAINSALMILRKKRTSPEISIESGADSDEKWATWEVPDHAPNPEKRYAQRERANILRGAISTLRPAIRRVVELQQLGERSMRETAGMIGISVSAAKARLFHGKAALRKAPRLRRIRANRGNQPASRFVTRAAASTIN